MKTKPASMLWELIGRLANTCLTFRISGEQGVGKEAIAHLIRRHYPNENSKFVKINCEDMSQFGGEKDLTGSCELTNTKLQSAFATPDNHVFFFEEVQCLPHKIQHKIAQLMTKNNSSAPPWVFASSTKPLEHYLAEKLQPELFTALDTIHIAVPPLRAHPDKIPQILSWYLNAYSKTATDTLPALPDARMMDQLLSYPWPGNLHQLQQTAWEAFETSDWETTIAGLNSGQNGKNRRAVDEIAAIYLMSLAQLSVQREKIIEGLMTVSNAGEIGLLDLAIYNEAVSQITSHISSDETEYRKDKH